ncbi:methyltransferase family protein [Methanoregula formicica SMSP]|uniref:Methyltransferase family protein n=2 Tax=Methanoregula formicica TaxID=882104 RepID=L0HC73_METFS|nr:methyltransferase family protein [Methanoregula formicica SMSP]
MYTGGDYRKNNPTWDVEDAPWKADLIFSLMEKHNLRPATVCDVGCGCGEILFQLKKKLPASTRLTEYEISPRAVELCKERENERLSFSLVNFCDEHGTSCDMILLIDLIEHLEDYYKFLRHVKPRSHYKILHIPLEMFVLAVLHPQFHRGQRKKVGHLHFFSRDMALQVLRDLGYDVLDSSYTAGYALPREYGLKDKLLKIPRALLCPVAPDFTVRVFSGYPLPVLVKS